jgi:hypothetical protein
MYQAPVQTAQILHFPVAQSTRLRTVRRLELEAQNYCAAADSASWYHQASIEADRKEISKSL